MDNNTEILLSNSDKVVNGLSLMLKSAKIGPLLYNHVDLSVGLMVVELAKRAPDNPEWFPKGKWATIQNIQSNIESELSKIKWN